MKDEPPKLKCIIVDDSALQRLAIKKLVQAHPSLTLLRDCNNALETKSFLENTPVDLIFLDIEMPILSGFDLLNNLEKKPAIIFVTGQTNHAFRAFEYEAVDFIQKPIAQDRFDRAIKKAISLPRFKELLNRSGRNNGQHIFVKSNLKKHKVYLDNLRYIEAFGDYVKVITAEEEYMVLSTMKSFENELPKDQFLRVHKSYIINLDLVKSYGSKWVQLGKEEIPLSRHKKPVLVATLKDNSAKKVNTDLYSQ